MVVNSIQELPIRTNWLLHQFRYRNKTAILLLSSRDSHLNQYSGNMASQGIGMEVSQCTSLGQAPSNVEQMLPQKARSPNPLLNAI